MLFIKKISVEYENRRLLENISLEFRAGTISLILGPNGSGKSTLAKTLIGYPSYNIATGQITLNPSSFYTYTPNSSSDLLTYSLFERSRLGIFQSFQSPVDFAGIAPVNFLKTIFNTHQRHRGDKEFNSKDFLDHLKSQISFYQLDFNFLNREFLEGMSGGEKKNFELLQLILLRPKFIILDEIDSGLDVDGIVRLAKTINRLLTPATTWMIISHNPSFIDHLEINQVNILNKGKLVDSGGLELAEQIKSKGFSSYV
jgi:Fe-S cluster assembly ATP-binding protein